MFEDTADPKEDKVIVQNVQPFQFNYARVSHFRYVTIITYGYYHYYYLNHFAFNHSGETRSRIEIIIIITIAMEWFQKGC